VLRRVVRFTEARERYARGRSQRIGQLAEQIAIKLNLPAERCSLMNVAGQLHDIGMLAVSEEILNKRSRLGTDEMRAVQRHSEISYEVLKPLECLSGVLEAIRRHHERMNGTGYPANLSGAQIPVEARILAVADAFDAMTHDRPHRAAMSPYDAFMELRRCTPAGYDTACVEALAGIINVPQLFMTLCGADRKEEATSEWAEEKVEGAADRES
jgi:HD-GYP domain-containing protein (c-di-GMP phosphodiesterase class II)